MEVARKSSQKTKEIKEGLKSMDLFQLFESILSGDKSKIQKNVKKLKENENLLTTKEKINLDLAQFELNNDINQFFNNTNRDGKSFEDFLMERKNQKSKKTINHFSILYNYVVVSRIGSRVMNLEQILDEEIINSDQFDGDYGKIKLAIHLFEYCMVHNKISDMIKILDFLINFYDLQKTQESKISELIKTTMERNDDGEQYLRGMPFYSSLLYASETYQCYLKSQPFYNKRETEIVILAMKSLLFSKIGHVQLCTKYMSLLKNKIEKLEKEIQKEKIDFENINNKKDLNKKVNYSAFPQTFGYSSTISNGLINHLKFLAVFIEATLEYKLDNYSSTISLLSGHVFKTNADSKKKASKVRIPHRNFYKFNSIGCCHLKMNRSSLAISYFNKAVAEVEGVLSDKEKEKVTSEDRIWSKNLKKDANLVAYNCALAYYQAKQYKKAIKLFSRLQISHNSNYLFWYRFGISHFNLATQIIKQKTNSLKNDLFSHIKNRKEPLSKLNDGGKDHLKRYYLNVESLDNWKHSGAVIDKMKYSLDCFYNSYNMVAKKINEMDAKNVYTRLSNFLAHDMVKGEGKMSKLGLKNLSGFKSKEMKKLQEARTSIMEYIAYINLFLEKAKSALIIIEKALKDDSLSMKQKATFAMYKVQAYQKMGKGPKALTLLEKLKLKKSLKKEDARCSLGFNSLSLQSEYKYTLKLVYAINLANLSLMYSDNSKKISGHVNKALLAVEGYQSNAQEVMLPPPLHHTMIYFYLTTDNLPFALQYLVRRRILAPTPTNPLLRICN